MKEREVKFNLKNISFYLSGFFIVGFGVNLLLRAKLGAGAWDTVNYNLKAVFPSLTLGMCSLIISIMIWGIVIAYRKKLKYLFMVLPLILIALSIDLWDISILGDVFPSTFFLKLLWAIGGAVILPFGLSLIISSNFPAFVFDELMIMLKEIFKTKGVSIVRIGIELFAILLAILLGFISGIGFGAVSYGSVVLAFTIGPFIGLYLKVLEKF